jgi:membrane-associated phospholipid phosphatase
VRIRPLEAINLLCLTVLTALTLVLFRRLERPGDNLLLYGVMGFGLALMIGLGRRGQRLPPALRVLLDFYPAAFIPFIFSSLGPLIPAARGPARDDLLIAADRALFGVDVTVWLERFVHPLATDFFFAAYATYYFLPLVLGGLLWGRDPAEGRQYIFTLTFCFYISYAGYFTIPALGPRFALAAEQSVSLETTPVSASIARSINELEHTKLDVFPSGHTMIAAAVLIVAFRRMRRVFWVLLPITACLIIATVYCRYHYVVDVLAGLVLAFLTVPMGDRLYGSMTRKLEPDPGRFR